jgi:hypothetical protein
MLTTNWFEISLGLRQFHVYLSFLQHQYGAAELRAAAA